MRTALQQLLEDFLSALVFLAVYALSASLTVATASAISIAVAQVGFAVLRKKSIPVMQWMAFGLVIALGFATLLTRDSRFIRIKPSIIHFALGAVMLSPGWQLRYLPPIAKEAMSARSLVVWGYAWAGLMFAMGLGNIAAAQFFDVPTWGLFIGGLLACKIAFFFLQYAVMRVAITRKLRATQKPIDFG